MVRTPDPIAVATSAPISAPKTTHTRNRWLIRRSQRASFGALKASWGARSAGREK